jgi:hypothetical protein
MKTTTKIQLVARARRRVDCRFGWDSTVWLAPAHRAVLEHDAAYPRI